MNRREELVLILVKIKMTSPTPLQAGLLYQRNEH